MAYPGPVSLQRLVNKEGSEEDMQADGQMETKGTEIGKVEIQTDGMCEEDTPRTEMSGWLLSWWWLCEIFKSF